MVVDGDSERVKDRLKFRTPALLNTITCQDGETAEATPLFLAAKAGNLPMMTLLCQHGADVTIAATLRDGGRLTPLEAALRLEPP